MKSRFELNFFSILLFHFFCFFASHIYVLEIFNEFPEFLSQLLQIQSLFHYPIDISKFSVSYPNLSKNEVPHTRIRSFIVLQKIIEIHFIFSHYYFYHTFYVSVNAHCRSFRCYTVGSFILERVFHVDLIIPYI